MSAVPANSVIRRTSRTAVAIGLVLVLALTASSTLFAKDKKKDKKPVDDGATSSRYVDRRKFWESLDYSKIVWPNPPAIARIRYLSFWSGEKFIDKKKPGEKKKQSWMERVSGVTTGETIDSKPRWQLVVPNGIAVDSKARVYIADSKVRAIFIVNTETGEYQMIKNGSDGKFQWLTGLAMDDTDRLFAADSGLHHVLVFGPDRKVEGVIAEKMVDPGGLAVDNENRLLYVADAEQDLVLVYDADPPYRFIRYLGKQGTKHTSTAPGEFAKPTGVAVDDDGNVYVADTWNDRIEVFDAEGQFIRTFGKAGDGPGYFGRPKGISIDSDGHLWVADSLQNRVQVFTPEGRLLIWMGSFGMLPGQFQALANVHVDKNNRVLTTEQIAGRLQIFRYVTNAEAKAEYERRNAEAKKKVEERRSSKATEATPDSAAPAAKTTAEKNPAPAAEKKEPAAPAK